MNRCIVLFVEGYTEVEFYKKVIAHIKETLPEKKFHANIECKNVKGVGGFKNIALRKFIKEIKPKYEQDCDFVIILCRDTDVFEFSSNPPVDWNEVEKGFLEKGAQKVIHIEARHSIEDWFLIDLEGILSFLRLSKKTKTSGGNGYEKLKNLFKKANKMYYKGIKSNGMIEKLNIDKIIKNVKKELAPIYEELAEK